MQYSFRYRRRLTKPPTPLYPVAQQPLVVVERVDPRLAVREQVTQSSAQR